MLSLGVGFSISRLKQLKIFCINPERINLAGWVDIVCWDKTGTLTEDNLEFQGTDSITSGDFKGFDHCRSTSHLLDYGLATCHSLQNGDELVGHFVDREMFKETGYKLLNCKPVKLGNRIMNVLSLISKQDSALQFYAVRRFDFDPHLQLASCLIAGQDQTSQMFFATVKGSPEAIHRVCSPTSLPSDYFDIYKRYCSQGFYVIAFAHRSISLNVFDNLNVKNLTRESLESNLVFVGFALFRSPIKRESFEAVKAISDAKIRNVIITGDSVLTAVHVARQLKIVDKVVLIEKDASGDIVFSEVPYSKDTWCLEYSPRHLHEICDFMHKFPVNEFEIAISCAALYDILNDYENAFSNWIIEATRIFARANPENKTAIIERLISLDHYTLMTGDGTNDCGALKAAHVGVALSNAEASIVAPFSSTMKSVLDIPKIIAEGRCALTTSFTAFKYMATYPMIQLVPSMIAYYYQTQMGDAQYIIDDLGIVFGLATFMLYTKPKDKISDKMPVKSLFSLVVLASLVGQMLINFFLTMGVFTFLSRQSWFCDSPTAQSGVDSVTFLPLNPVAPIKETYPCYKFSREHDVKYDTLLSTYESSFPWLFSHFQYIGMALAFSLSHKFRRGFWTNHLFSLWILLVSFIAFY